jgi:glycerol-3-phosphate cytidylyltransferase
MSTENEAEKPITVLTCGTFDIFHVGHLRMLERCRAHGDRLIVGVSTDALNYSKKQRNPIVNEHSRKEILKGLKCVDEVFDEESLEQKRDYCLKYKADIFIIGDDWEGKFDHLSDICKVVYLTRTPGISTTELIELIRE